MLSWAQQLHFAVQFECVHLSLRVFFSCFEQQRHISQRIQTSSSSFFSSKTAAGKAEVSEKVTESADTDTDETATRDERAAAESDMKTEEKSRQTVTVTVTEAATATAAEADVRTERVMSFKSRMNIRLLAAIQMMLRVLLIFQTGLLCFHADQSDIR